MFTHRFRGGLISLVPRSGTDSLPGDTGNRGSRNQHVSSRFGANLLLRLRSIRPTVPSPAEVELLAMHSPEIPHCIRPAEPRRGETN